MSVSGQCAYVPCSKFFQIARAGHKWCSNSCRVDGHRHPESVRPAPRPISKRDYVDLAPDALWPSDNYLGIPTLDIALMADALDIPFAQWGSMPRSDKMQGTWHFYTDDERFAGLVKNPQRVVNTGCVAAVECNFSMDAATPNALVLGVVYRKRELARYWQSQGIKIFVDLNTSPALAHDNLLGVPPGWTAFATRGYADEVRLQNLTYQYKLACAVAGIGNTPLFVVYAGGAQVEAMAKKYGWVYLPDWTGQRGSNGYI